MRDQLDPPPFWEAHDEPNRPFDGHVSLCACVDCETAIRNEARRSPQRPIFLKTAFDRIAVTLEYFIEMLDRDALCDLLYVKEDYIRDIYVSDDGWLPHRTRWFSTVCREDEKAEDRNVRQRRKAIRQSAKTLRRREKEWRAEVEKHPPQPPVVLPTLAEVIGPARQEHRDVVLAATRWCLAEGRPIDPDLIALICAVLVERERCDSNVWTRRRVHELLRCHTWNWCTFAGCWNPDGVPEALWMFLGFLAATDRLDPASQPLDRLRDALRCVGLGDDGLPRDQGTPDFRCECNRPDRGPTHGEVCAGHA